MRGSSRFSEFPKYAAASSPERIGNRMNPGEALSLARSWLCDAEPKTADYISCQWVL